MVVRVREGLRGEDWAVPEELAALRPPEALVVDLEQVLECIRRVERLERELSCNDYLSHFCTIDYRAQGATHRRDSDLWEKRADSQQVR